MYIGTACRRERHVPLPEGNIWVATDLAIGMDEGFIVQKKEFELDLQMLAELFRGMDAPKSERASLIDNTICILLIFNHVTWGSWREDKGRLSPLAEPGRKLERRERYLPASQRVWIRSESFWACRSTFEIPRCATRISSVDGLGTSSVTLLFLSLLFELSSSSKFCVPHFSSMVTR